MTAARRRAAELFQLLVWARDRDVSIEQAERERELGPPPDTPRFPPQVELSFDASREELRRRLEEMD